MCGLAGIFDWKRRTHPDDLEQIVRRMISTLRHRGPDDQGIHVDANCGIALGHRRLAIVDLSPAGAQPYTTRSGRWTLVFNGEIYNHRELRRELESTFSEFRGHSDTEVLAETIERHGFDEAIERSVGMFAVAAFDRNQRCLLLARDRLGEKPLYYSERAHGFAFASELRALRTLPDWNGKLSQAGVAAYFQHGYVPSPLSIHEEVRKIPPGSTGRINESGQLRLSSYWRPRAPDRKTDFFSGSPREAVDELDRLLGVVVSLQHDADVPVGALLSGGVDSGTVVSRLASQNSHVKTFTATFVDDPDFNEGDRARVVASHLGTTHVELPVRARDALDVVPELSEVWDEPFADSSQVPTLLISRLVRRHVTVALSADGGDELFAGYNSYVRAAKWESPLRRVAPAAPYLRPWAERLALPGSGRWARAQHYLQRVLEVAEFGEENLFAWQAVLHTPNRWPLRAQPAPRSLELGSLDALEPTTSNRLYDLDRYLPDDILVKVDRAAMSTSLETRAPLLDHRIVEFALSLPMDLLWREGTTKWPLREVMRRYVPLELTQGPKRGFGIPLARWLRVELRPLIEEHLAPRAVEEIGVLRPQIVRRLWSEHLSGARDWKAQIWSLLLFQMWARRYGAS